MKKIELFLLIIVTIIIIISIATFIKNLYDVLDEAKNLNINENFDTFSPYRCNPTYPFYKQKLWDQKMLQNTLEKWEKPFNKNDEGYWNAEPSGKPPLVKIYSYDDRHKVRFH